MDTPEPLRIRPKDSAPVVASMKENKNASIIIIAIKLFRKYNLRLRNFPGKTQRSHINVSLKTLLSV